MIVRARGPLRLGFGIYPRFAINIRSKERSRRIRTLDRQPWTGQRGECRAYGHDRVPARQLSAAGSIGNVFFAS